MSPGRRFREPLCGTASALLAVLLAGCGGGGGAPPVSGPQGNAELGAIHYGRLADVYGLRRVGRGTRVELFRKDVLTGLDIADERTGSSKLEDHEILYDFITPDPDTLQPRLLITREVDSPEFRRAFDALDDKTSRLVPALFGEAGRHTVVPRNAAIRLTFSRPLGIGENFFVARDERGRVSGVKNSEAVQLLNIVGDPTDDVHAGDFEVIPARVLPRGNRLILDPVLLGSEGLRYQTRNNASGLPEAPNQEGANIRIAVALEGALRIPGIREDRSGNLTGRNNSGQRSVVRDFRSGNRADESPEISQGFLRDPIPPRIAGEILMFLEAVEDEDPFTQVLTVYKHGVEHEIDRGDVMRVSVDNSGVPVAVTEVTVDPRDDLGEPAVQHVRVRVRRTPGLAEHDPRRIPGYPSDLREREPWLVKNAPRVTLVCEYVGERRKPDGGVYGDDPRNFITFSPSPMPLADGTPSPPNENVSPFAGANIRFTKPVDISLVKALDTFFFGTRNLLDPGERDRFLADRGIDPSSFRQEKFVTPHLVAARVFDEDGSQTVLRLQPQLGFYLDEAMRKADEGKPFAKKKFKYFLHLVGGKNGVRDLSGNIIDFQVLGAAARDFLVIPFSLDTRRNPNGEPRFADNLVVTVARRFAGADEDEQPSYYLPDEVQRKGQPPNAQAFNLPDMFGAFRRDEEGGLSARMTSRTSKMVDDIVQKRPPSQTSPMRWCPQGWSAQRSTARPFNGPLQNPLNPFGCRLQTVWREIDFSLSRIEPNDFNLDVEQLYWCPFRSATIYYDEFDRMTVFLGHSERRPVTCRRGFNHMRGSGLDARFANNYARDVDLSNKPHPTDPHPAFQDKRLLIDTTLVVNRSSYRYLPLPKFEKPYFVWRDETSDVQGGNSRFGGDVRSRRSFSPYLLSPFLGGKGRFVKVDRAGQPSFDYGHWSNAQNYRLRSTNFREDFTDGSVGTIALPLLADFWTYPDSPDLPKGFGFIAWGGNGWQISVPMPGFPTPNIRVYSAGGIVRGKPVRRGPNSDAWSRAVGGFTPNGVPTRGGDNSVFWVMADFLKRTTVVTAGFVDILDPHRMPKKVVDPRLGPFFGGSLPRGVLPRYAYDFEPVLERLPGGTSVRVEFRGAGEVDPDPWRAKEEGYTPKPDETNFPLDPRKAGDAGIRKYDDRIVGGSPRNAWTGFYNRNVTDYVAEPNELTDVEFTQKFSGPNESFLPEDVRYVNWRFVMRNNVDASPPVSPRIESFVFTYRFEKRR